MVLTDAKRVQVQEALPSPSELKGKDDIKAFTDNIEHLESLEYISRLRLARCYLLGGNAFVQSDRRRRSPHFRRDENLHDQPDLTFLENFTEDVSPDEIGFLLKGSEASVRQRVKKSLEQGIELHFEEFCQSYELDDFERTVLALLIANNTGKAFRDFYEKSELDPHGRQGGGMSIGAILAIIHSDYREQITSRRYFSVNSCLIRQEILIPWGSYDSTTNILDVCVYLHERIVRYLLGDNNIYDLDFQCISRDRSPVRLDQVVLPGKTKEKVLKLAGSYSSNESKKARVLVDQFYGYGTGLIFLFHGSSGTGKTMLAHALATDLKKELLTVNMDYVSKMMGSSEELIKYVFKEARLCDGIVFFDECDEMFHANSRDSRTLLIEIEKADCITIMATNKVVELDPAMDRRITMKVPFFLPNETERERIWKALVPPNVSLARDVNFKSLAGSYIFSGGLIKNALFMAITNAMSRNGKSKLFLKSSDIEEAAGWQAASMFDLHSFGRNYLPQTSMKDLPLRPSDRRKFEKLANVCVNLNNEIHGLRLLMGCSDIQTGVNIVDAVAKECNLKVREFDLSDLLLGTDNSDKKMDPITRQEITLLEYALRTGTGHRSLTLLVDHEALFEKLLLEGKESGDKGLDLWGFYRKLKGFEGLLFLVTTPTKMHSLPMAFSHYFEVQPPPEELQLQKWEEHLGNNKDTQDRLVDLVEQNPFHLNQISRIVQEAKTTALLKGTNTITFDDVHEALKRFRNMKTVPVLFGAMGN